MAIVGALSIGRMGAKLPVAAAGPFYDPAADVLFPRMTVQPDATRKALISKAITDLKSAGVWDKLETLYFPAAHDAQAGQLNWKENSYSLVPINSPVFTIDRGYKGDGSSSYLDTGWYTGSKNLFQGNAASMGVYVNNEGGLVPNNTSVVMGSGSCVILTKATSGLVRGRVNGQTTQDLPPTVVPSRMGSTALNRTATNNTDVYRDGVQVGSGNTASVTRNTVTFALLGFNSSGTMANWSTEQIAMAFMGGVLAPTEIAAFDTITRSYLTAIGAN